MYDGNVDGDDMNLRVVRGTGLHPKERASCFVAQVYEYILEPLVCFEK